MRLLDGVRANNGIGIVRPSVINALKQCNSSERDKFE